MPELSGEDGAGLQEPFTVAVVIPTVVRPELLRAVRSVYAQDLAAQGGRIQILIGIDKALGERDVLERVRAECPSHCGVTILDLGYSTSQRNGGLYRASDGGGLRTLLSIAANSHHVAYLDDDNWWAPEHLGALMKAVEGKSWAHSLRWLVDEMTGKKIVVDRWHSVGPGRGVFADVIGGFSDPSCLLIDRRRCLSGLHMWTQPIHSVDNDTADKAFYLYLIRRHGESFGRSGEATAYYVMRRRNKLWDHLREAGILPPPAAADG